MNRMTRSVSKSLTDSFECIHDSANFSFIAVNGVKELGRLNYRLSRSQSRSTMDLYHTHTLPEAQGRGIAGKLVSNALEWARLHQMSVIPSCSYVSSFLEKNPQWKTLI